MEVHEMTLRQLEKQATSEQLWSAHCKAIDTTGEMTGEAYEESYEVTLRLLLDS